MISLRQFKRYGAYSLWVLVIFFIAYCGRSGEEQGTTEVAPLPSGESQVAYGSSLSEWEEATQSNTGESTADPAPDQAAVTNASPGENTQSVSPLAVAALASPLETSASADGGSDAASKEDLISAIGVPFTLNNTIYREILWDGLIPADYSAKAIMSKYSGQLAEIEDGSPEASALYKKMQEEFNSAPVNDILNEVPVRLPGFITPLEYTGNLITEFLLVPYFGACIHTPPPPINQTVLVQVAEGNGIKPEDSYNPIWVMGKLTTEETTTELASAGYYIEEATFEPYTSQQ